MGDSIPISDRANQKDTAATDRVYPGNSAPQRGSSWLAARAAGVGRGGAHGGSRSREVARGRKRRRGSTWWRWVDPPNSSDTLDLAASMAAQGRGVWLGPAATTAARDGVRSICLHATKIRKVLTTTASDESGDEAAAAQR